MSADDERTSGGRAEEGLISVTTGGTSSSSSFSSRVAVLGTRLDRTRISKGGGSSDEEEESKVPAGDIFFHTRSATLVIFKWRLAAFLEHEIR